LKKMDIIIRRTLRTYIVRVLRGWNWLGTLCDARFWFWGSQIWDLGFYFRILFGFMKNDLPHLVGAALGKI